MFGKMLDVSSVRSTTGAFWFYLMSVIVLFGTVHVLEVTGVLGMIGSMFTGHDINTIVSTGFVLIISSLILTGRHLTSDLLSIVLTVVGVYLTYTSDVMIGLVPIALLTTLKK